jgi:hypothetical protein
VKPLSSSKSHNATNDVDDSDLISITLEEGYDNSRGNNVFYTLHVFCIFASYSFGGILPYSIPFLVKQPDLL